MRRTSSRWQGSRGGAVALAMAFVFAGSSGCKKGGEAAAPSPSGAPGAPAAPAAKTYKFAFVTNNSSDFWNIAEKGVHKAEKDLGIQAVVMRPLKTDRKSVV